MNMYEFIKAFCGPDRTELETLTECGIQTIPELRAAMQDAAENRYIINNDDSEVELDFFAAAATMWLAARDEILSADN